MVTLGGYSRTSGDRLCCQAGNPATERPPVIDPTAVTGIRDPGDLGRWLVVPWPVTAGFCEVVRHFLPAHAGLLGDKRTDRQVAFFEGYQAALLAASTDDLRHPTAWHWRDELLGCLAECVAIYRVKQAEQRAADVRRLPVAASRPRERAS
jgi:hypothetical protein